MDLSDVGTFLAVLGRVAAWMYAAPFVGEKMVAPKVRMAASILFALLLTPSRAAVPVADVMFVLPTELLLGLCAGFAARLPLAIAEGAGQLVGLQLELGFAQTLNPLLHEESLPTRSIAYSIAGLAFLSVGGLEASLRVLGAPGMVGLGSHALPLLLQRFTVAAGNVMPMALLGAAPVLVAAVVANLAVGLMSRASPGFNVLQLMMVAVLTVGGGVLWATAPSFTHALFGVSQHAAYAAADLLSR